MAVPDIDTLSKRHLPELLFKAVVDSRRRVHHFDSEVRIVGRIGIADRRR